MWHLARTPVREIKIKIDDIYVPVKRRKSFDSERADVLAEDILAHGQINAILVRKDEERFVLVEGLHRLEACKLLGEDTIVACIVQARRS
jgi:sulfiredoxin